MNTDTEKDRRTLVVIAGLIGNVMEWYDFAVYGYFAAIIGQLFFPSSDPTISLIASFGTFAVGFMTRPVGGLLFGRLGDTHGRQKAMSISVLTMAVPTVLMALIPTYDQVGVLAPVALVLLRIVQGLSVGGEYTSSLIFLAEHGQRDRKAYTSIWGLWGAVLGMLIGSVVGLATSSMMSQTALEIWGWRVPFALGGVVALIGWSVRRKLPPEKQTERTAAPVGELFRNYRMHILRIILINIGSSVAYYTVFVYALTYIRNFDHFSETRVFELNTVSMVVLLLALPLSARCADRFGKLKMLTAGLTILVLAGIPLFELMHSPSSMHALIAEVLFAILVSVSFGGLVALNVELLPAQVRCTGLAFAFNLTVGIFGGTTPLVATWLVRSSGNPIAPGYWLVATQIVSLLAVLLLVRQHQLYPADRSDQARIIRAG